MYVMDKPSKWEDYLHLEMSPYEALYGRRCRTPVTWDNPVNMIVIGLDFLKEMEQEVAKIRQNLKASRYRQKRYADKNRVHRKFNVGIMFTSK